jgi:citrate synthase
MKSEAVWHSSISAVAANEIRVRGYRIDELMGETSFVSAIYLVLMGELPDREESRLLEAMLISSIDHGAVTPSTLAARTAASTGAPLNAALAAGVLSINRFHGGAIEDCMHVLKEGLQRAAERNIELEKAALELVHEFRHEKRRIAGLGHRLHDDDPRTRKLFSLASELGLADGGVAMMLALEGAFREIGKSLPINVDGALAALLLDLKVPVELANAFFIMARLPGLAAHIREEQTRQRPMRSIHPDALSYDGPEPRSL